MKKTVKHNVEWRGIKFIDPGDEVYCDICNKDFTNLKDIGGLLFQSKGVCPDCEPRFMDNVRRYNEELYIRKRCPPDKSFAKFIREDCR